MRWSALHGRILPVSLCVELNEFVDSFGPIMSFSWWVHATIIWPFIKSPLFHKLKFRMYRSNAFNLLRFEVVLHKFHAFMPLIFSDSVLATRGESTWETHPTSIYSIGKSFMTGTIYIGLMYWAVKVACITRLFRVTFIGFTNTSTGMVICIWV